MSALPGWKFRLAEPADAEAFTRWTLGNPQIDPKDIEAAKKDNNPTVLFFAVENADGVVVAFAPVYLQAIVAHLVFNPNVDGRDYLSAMQMLLNGVTAFEIGLGVREIVTLSKEDYGVAKWAMKHGFDVEPRQVFRFDINKVLAVAKEETICAPVAEKVAANDQALQDANLAANTNFLNDAKVSFAEQQQIQAKQTALANNLIANPMGYSPKQLAIASTNINENFSRAAKSALGSAAAFAAAHGASDIGGGATGQIAGQIGSEVAGGAAKARADLAAQNEAMKRESMLTGLSELNTAGGAAQSAVGGSISGAGTSGETTTNAGSGVLAAKAAGWQELGGVLGGISGLAQAGASAFTGYEAAH